MKEYGYVNLLLVKGPTEDYMAVCPYEVDVCVGDIVQIDTEDASIRAIVLEKFASYEDGTVLRMFQRMVGEPEIVKAVYKQSWEAK